MNGIIGQFVCFGGVGLIATLAHYIVLFFLVEVAKISPVLSSTIGFIVGALVSYFLNYHFTFRSNKCHSEAIIKFFVVALIGLALNNIGFSTA